VITEPTPAKGIGVPSAVITGMEEKRDKEVKDEESGDMMGSTRIQDSFRV
jgi:hypothetical protein